MVRRLTMWFIVCALGVGIALTMPSRSAAAFVQGAEAAQAIDAARSAADLTGITFEADGEVHQRNATGDVAVLVDGRRVDQMVVREDRGTRLFTPYKGVSKYPRIVKAVRAAYGVDPRLFVVTDESADVEGLYATWFDPFAQIANDPGIQVVVDEAGRAAEVRVDGAARVRIIRWSAPLAVPPARDAMITPDTAATMAAVEESADFTYALVKQLAGMANRDPAYRQGPASTVRRIARDTGWQVKDSRAGVSVTVTDGLGATWKAVLVALRSGVRVDEFSLTSPRLVMSATEAQARLSLSVMAMSQVDLMSCPASCRLTGKPVRLTAANAEGLLLARLGTIGISGQTPGPVYPLISDGMSGSFGLTTSGARVRGAFSMSAGGFCLEVPITGPGVLPRPTSYRADVGRVGPWGACMPS